MNPKPKIQNPKLFNNQTSNTHNSKFDTISVIGLGYIGLPTAAAFASRKIKVIGVDVNQEAVDIINQGKIHIIEPDLDIAVQSAVNAGYLTATITPEPADAFLIAVPTPFKGDHEPDLAYIESATKAIAPVLKEGDLVILESTSPVGTTEKMAEWISEQRPDLVPPPFNTQNPTLNIKIAHCPERVLPGHVMRELIENDRVIGGLTPECSQASVELYKIFVQGDCIITNARTAEMAKLTENSFRDVNIAFANELSLICDKLDINVWELIKLANRHPRVNILQPGPGVGGHCIAVDPWFIVNKTPDEAKLIHASRLVNDGKPHYIINLVKEAAEKHHNPIIACFGLAFKADIDDLRESPALAISQILAESSIGKLILVEPNIATLPSIFSNMENVELGSIDDAINDADIILGLVDHKEFKSIKLESLNNKNVIDAKGLWVES